MWLTALLLHRPCDGYPLHFLRREQADGAGHLLDLVARPAVSAGLEYPACPRCTAMGGGRYRQPLGRGLLGTVRGLDVYAAPPDL